MAMMISKFHKLIQSRVLWGAILIVIIFSFVIWGMAWPSQMDEAERQNAAGMLDGQTVSFNEYRSAYLSTTLARALSNAGREMPSTPGDEEIIRRMSWLRLATLREAAKMGVFATDADVVQALRANFADKDTGAYNPQYYQAFLANVIAPLRFTVTQFENHLREEITIQKLANLIGRQTLVTPLEIRRTFDTLMDTFTVDYATIRYDALEATTTVSEDEIRAAYDEAPERFTLPETRDLSYAAFDVASFVDDSFTPDEDALLDYYELHLADYTTTETAEDGSTNSIVADFNDVKDGITTALRLEAAAANAYDAASELYSSSLPGNDGLIPNFSDVVRAAGLEVQTAKALSRMDMPVVDGGAAFTEAAFSLALDSYDRASAPVIGTNHIYVLYLDAITAPRVPSFEEAHADAAVVAKQKAVAEAVAARAKEIKAAAETGIAAGQSLKASLKDLNVPVAAAPTFTGLTGSSATNAAVRALVQAVVAYNPGEITDPIPAADGVLIAYIKARQAADPAEFDTYREEISNAIRNRRAQDAFQNWQVSLLAPERFTDLQRTPTDDDEPDNFDEEEIPAEETPAEGEAAAVTAEDASGEPAAATAE